MRYPNTWLKDFEDGLINKDQKAFDNADEAIKAACSYANKHNEKATVEYGTEYAYGYFEFIIRFEKASFHCNKDLRRFFGIGNAQFTPLYELILDKYGSIEEFVNRHSKLLVFL